MRCYCCNNILTPQEASAKFKASGNYTETCKKCLKTMDVPVIFPKQAFEKDEEEVSYDQVSVDELHLGDDDLWED